MKYQTVLLDADNTLMDFADAEHQALVRTFLEHNIHFDESIKQHYQSINQNLWKQFEQNKISKENLLASRFALLFNQLKISGIDAVNFNRKYLFNLGFGNKTMPHAQETCHLLHQMGCRLYILTNGVADTQYQRLSSSSIYPYLSDIFVSEDVGFQKPRKEFFDYVFSHIPHFISEKALMVGDSISSDMQGAANVGIDRCWFNFESKPLPDFPHIHYTITSLLELPDIVLGK